MPLSMIATFTPRPALAWPPSWSHTAGAPIWAGVANMSSWNGMSGVTARTPGRARTAAASLADMSTAMPLSTTWYERSTWALGAACFSCWRKLDWRALSWLR